MDNFDFIFGHFNAVGIVEFRQRPMDYIYWIGVGFSSVVWNFEKRKCLSELFEYFMRFMLRCRLKV